MNKRQQMQLAHTAHTHTLSVPHKDSCVVNTGHVKDGMIQHSDNTSPELNRYTIEQSRSRGQIKVRSFNLEGLRQSQKKTLTNI